MRKTIIIQIVWLILPSVLFSQTVNWAVKPIYSSIETITDNLYKIKSGNQCGIVDKQGKIIVNAEVDSITPFVEDNALLLDSQGGKYKIRGIINRRGEVNILAETYYVTSWPYFQNGYLVVSNPNGLYGFMNNAGKEAISCKYKNAHPFSEGFASVTLLNDRVIYINTFEQPLQLEPGDGEIYLGTTFRNAEALVCTVDKKMYLIKQNGNIKSKIKKSEFAVDAMYCLCTDGISMSVPAVQLPDIPNGGPVPYKEQSLYGFRNGSTIVLPPQFTDACPFKNDVAKVMQNGKYGLLKIVSTDSISAKVNKTALKVEKMIPETLNYTATVPKELSNIPLELTVTNVNSTPSEIRISAQNGNTERNYSFTPSVVKGVETYTNNYTFQLSGDDLILRKEQQSIAFRKIPEYLLAVSPGSSKANEANVASVNILLSNSSDFPLKMKVSVDGTIKPVEIKAFEKKSLSATFKDVNIKEFRKVRVTVPNGKTQERSVEVIPFYQEN